MTGNELLGQVAALYLRRHLPDQDAMGTARYRLDGLNASQIAAVARGVLQDAVLSLKVDLKLPRRYLEGYGLPDEILTDATATHCRNADCRCAILLVVDRGDDEEASVVVLEPLGIDKLRSCTDLWVEAANERLSLSEEHCKWWAKALQGLNEAYPVSLERFADYVAETRNAALPSQQGHAIRSALGWALPKLRLPRDTGYFNGLNAKTALYPSKWRPLYATAFKRRACYLLKQTPSQTILGSEDLNKVFSRVSEAIPDDLHGTVQAYIDADSGWNEAASNLAMCEWERIKPLFDGLGREKYNLGEETRRFYMEGEPELLSDKDLEYLKGLTERRTTEPLDDDKLFFRGHRNELKQKPALKIRWDKFIFGSAIESEDLLAGLAECLQGLFDQGGRLGARTLTILSDRRQIKELKELNEEAGLYFAQRFKGIKNMFGSNVIWEVGRLFEFRELVNEWHKQPKYKGNHSTAKGALQIKFYIQLEAEGAQGLVPKQLIWKYSPNSISSQLCSDWERLVKTPLVVCSADRETVSTKGKVQWIDLRDVRSLRPSYDRDRGTLVSVYAKDNDIRIGWRKALASSRQKGLIDDEVVEELSNLFEKFQGTYSKAVRDFFENGVAADSLMEQASEYAELLVAICTKAQGDWNRLNLLRPLLAIGTVLVDSGPVAGIVPPWHPLRMAAMSRKAKQVAELVRYLLRAEDIHFGDTGLYFDELKAELTHPYYPELALGWTRNRPELLCLTDSHLDYSLHECPISSSTDYSDTNENPAETANKAIDIIRRYLQLNPHERANLSIVLYNCDSARLPQAIVDRINQVHEDEEDMRCQVVLRHRNGGKLRDLYERIIESSDVDIDSFIASEASSDFMARLRIGIMVDQAPPPNRLDGPPTDIVFSQDVIARHAQLEWYTEDATPVGWGEWIPARWSRRRPAASDDLKSVVYLCCPVAADEGWAYLTALTTFFKGDWDQNTERRLLPARQLNFNDPLTSSIFGETHDLGNWVVNYDELLDRRQLRAQNVKVIRYKQAETQGRNLLVSSTASLGLLSSMVLNRIKDLNLDLKESDCAQLAERLIEDANAISGDLALRAAKRGRNASELIGVVLSRFLIKHELADRQHFGWYFLDDFSDWLGQSEGQVADILALSPTIDDEQNRKLTVVVSEAKYIDYQSLAAKRKESQKQLRQTVDRISKALFGDPSRLDRDIWLSRFSDMVLHGIEFPATAGLDLSRWRRAIRAGECQIYLRGYSHIFVSGPSEMSECSSFTTVPECDNSYQEVFSRSRLQALLIHYWRQTNPMLVRQQETDTDVWSKPQYRTPSARAILGNLNLDQDASENGNTPTPLQYNAQVLSALDVGIAQDDVNNEVGLCPVANVNWAYPTIHSFIDNTSSVEADSAEDIAWLESTKRATVRALQEFHLQSKLISATLTPNAALLKFQGSANLTVDQVVRKRTEFLTTHRLHLISIAAEPGVVALSVARPTRRVLSLIDVWRRWKPNSARGNQELLVGVKEEDDSLLLLSPRAHAPHTLIAGSTGSGKSVLMQNIILGIACTNTPAQATITVIDPKLGVDYFAFEALPHLSGGLITDQESAIRTLSRLTEEMDRRYQVLKDNRVNDIFALHNKSNASERPPVLWIVHDEFAEWMMTENYRDSVTDIVGRLGVKARAAGIFLIFAAQRPDAHVMPMQLRANLGNRLVLRVDSEGTSEIALGQPGAERLLGKGQMAARLEGEPSTIIAQVPYASADTLETIAQSVSKSASEKSVQTLLPQT